jgi:hypothetical protein
MQVEKVATTVILGLHCIPPLDLHQTWLGTLEGIGDGGAVQRGTD